MKKSLLILSIMLGLAIILAGCATTGDLEKLQSQINQINAKADQSLKASQDAKDEAGTAKTNVNAQVEQANAAAMKAEAAAARAEGAAKTAEGSQKAEAEAVFKKSMKK